jgi:SNF2 family DNA or RNA helicase
MKDTRVIMLSLEHAASGTNLTEATHIILIDPVAGSQSEAFSTEQQAIGRAHRMGQNKQVTSITVCYLFEVSSTDM